MRPQVVSNSFLSLVADWPAFLSVAWAGRALDGNYNKGGKILERILMAFRKFLVETVLFFAEQLTKSALCFSQMFSRREDGCVLPVVSLFSSSSDSFSEPVFFFLSCHIITLS